jgi:cytochrome P450
MRLTRVLSMADLGFGQDIGMQDGKGDQTVMSFMHDYMRMTAMLGTLRNICDLLPYLPSDTKTRDFKKTCKNMLARRLGMGTSRRDVCSRFLNEDANTGVQFTHQQLGANILLLIIAGSGKC